MKVAFLTTAITVMGVSLSVTAQKLPKIQQNSIWMENFEADGKLDEWQHPLQAFNNNTHIAYSLANDDMYLYLAVKSNRTQKILIGGITLEVIGKNGKPVSVIYPYNITHDRRTDPSANQPGRVWNIAAIKEMEVSGIAGITDKTIPILNEYGLLAGIESTREDSDIFENGEPYYLVEMAVPLQYYGLDPEDITGGSELDYRIALRGILNGPQFGGVMRGTGMQLMPDGSLAPLPQARVEYFYQMQLDENTHTELKGTYRLARQPE